METLKNNIPEQTALELCEALEKARVNSETFVEISTQTMDLIIQNTYKELQLESLRLWNKVQNANFFTGWYWSRKYSKVIKKLKALNSNNELMTIISKNITTLK